MGVSLFQPAQKYTDRLLVVLGTPPNQVATTRIHFDTDGFIIRQDIGQGLFNRFCLDLEANLL